MLTADDFEALDAEGDPRDWYLHPHGGQQVQVTAYVDAADPEEALRNARGAVERWLRDHQIEVRLVAVRVLTEDALEAEADNPSIPSLASAADAAELLRVSRQRVHQLSRQHPQFPEPAAHLATGPVWTRAAIEHFARVWERKPGRPARKAS